VGRVTVRITNDYSDGHASNHTVALDAPTAVSDEELDEWFEDVVFPETGDGHGTDEDLGYCYTARIVAADDESLIGACFEWVGS
jgi:hypothetical protein